MSRPSSRDILKALHVVARITGSGAAFVRDGSYYFELGDGWLLSVSPDDAGRFRVGALYGSTEVARLWSLAGDHGRLAALARGLQTEIAALA